MNPRFGNCKDLDAIVQHEGVRIGVAEVAEGLDGTCWVLVDGGDGLVSRVGPNQLHAVVESEAFHGLEVEFAVIRAPREVGGAIDDPGDPGIGSARQDDVFLAGWGGQLGSAWREAQREGRKEEDSNRGHNERWLS